MISQPIVQNIFLIVGPDNPHCDIMWRDVRAAKQQWPKAEITFTVIGRGGNSSLNIKDIAICAARQPKDTLVVIDVHGFSTSDFHQILLDRNEAIPTTRLLHAITQHSNDRNFQYILLACQAGKIHSDLNCSSEILPKGTRIATLNAADEDLDGEDVMPLIRNLPKSLARGQDPLQATLSLWSRYNSRRTTTEIITV